MRRRRSAWPLAWALVTGGLLGLLVARNRGADFAPSGATTTPLASAVASSASGALPPVGALLEAPLRTNGTRPPEACSRGDARSFAITGDPATRIIDTVWRWNDCVAEVPAPVPRLAVAMRLIDTANVEGHVYARVETVAYRAQPVGMRTWIDLDDGLPTASNAPIDRAAALALLPPVEGREAAIFPRGTDGKPPRSAEWLVPSGIAVEEVYQQTFRREKSRLGAGDPLLASLRDKLASGRHGCDKGWSLPPTIGRCWGNVAGFDDVAFIAPAGDPGGPPLVRAVGRTIDGRQVLGPAPPQRSETEHRQAIEAYLARQPLTGTLLATGPLSGDGGSSGVFFSPAPVPRIFVVAVDGPASAIHVDGPLDALHRKGLTSTSVVRAVVLGPSGADGYFGSALIWFERPGERPWSSVVAFAHPYRSPKGPGFGNHEILPDGAHDAALSKANTFEEARAAVSSHPSRPALD